MARISFSATGDRDLPLAICEYFDTDEDPEYYGDRVCNNGIAGAIMSILFAMAFMTAELQAACATSKVTYQTISCVHVYGHSAVTTGIAADVIQDTEIILLVLHCCYKFRCHACAVHTLFYAYSIGPHTSSYHDDQDALVD